MLFRTTPPNGAWILYSSEDTRDTFYRLPWQPLDTDTNKSVAVGNIINVVNITDIDCTDIFHGSVLGLKSSLHKRFRCTGGNHRGSGCIGGSTVGFADCIIEEPARTTKCVRGSMIINKGLTHDNPKPFIPFFLSFSAS